MILPAISSHATEQILPRRMPGLDFEKTKANAANGNASAQYNLGVMYEQGIGTPEDLSEAAKWYRRAAEQGDPEAQSNLGVLYDQGRGMAQDQAAAAKWYAAAAEKGHTVAQFNLSILLEHGFGIRQDERKAAFWCERAAKQGMAAAQSNLALLYVQGRAGLLQNFREAMKWNRKAADQGLAQAQHNIGVMYARGLGVKIDFVEAYKWFSLAAAQRYNASVSVLYLLAQMLTAPEIAEAKRRIARSPAGSQTSRRALE